MWQEGIWNKEFCVKMTADDQCDYTRDDRFQKGTASAGTNLLFLKTCIHFKHPTVAKEPLPFINNYFCILKAIDVWNVPYLTVFIRNGPLEKWWVGGGGAGGGKGKKFVCRYFFPLIACARIFSGEPSARIFLSGGQILLSRLFHY